MKDTILTAGYTVLTPAAAMGDVLLTRLPAAGVTFETEAVGR